MSQPVPLFDTYKNFQFLTRHNLDGELSAVLDAFERFSNPTEAMDGYSVVKLFLKSYAANQATFNSYRTHVERLLLWSLLVCKKPILHLRRQDAEAFLEFCLNPPDNWVGPVTKARFVRIGGRKKADSDTFVINVDWRPFNYTVSKATRKLADETDSAMPEIQAYQMSQTTIAQVFTVCGSFYQFCIDEDYTDANPFRAVKQKSRYKQSVVSQVTSRSLTQLQWEFVIETAEHMADQEPEFHERTLFILTTLFSMYLRVSDLTGRDNWQPTMGSFKKAGDNWWFHVVGKGNKAAKVSVRDSYLPYLVRYRTSLGLTDLPYPGEQTPLLSSLDGRTGLSGRRIRELIQMVFDAACARMIAEGLHEDCDALRAASLHWLRHTSATLDAPFRDMKDLQADLRHESLSTTQDSYYDSLDDQRASSIKAIPIKGR
ncbi:tyrosine-type recombinase/integrase [Halopseudomonas litoralis]|nr:integrase [Halopseudomonas litoralis]